MNWIFRDALVSDIERMFSVRARTRQNPLSKEDLIRYGITAQSTASRMTSGEIAGWVCQDGSELVGFCIGVSTTGEVEVLAVLPDYEGKGIGKELLSRVVAQLRAKGFTTPWLAASPDPGIRAYGFYRALGWRETSRSLKNGDQILELPAD